MTPPRMIRQLLAVLSTRPDQSVAQLANDLHWTKNQTRNAVYRALKGRWVVQSGRGHGCRYAVRRTRQEAA